MQSSKYIVLIFLVIFLPKIYEKCLQRRITSFRFDVKNKIVGWGMLFIITNLYIFLILQNANILHRNVHCKTVGSSKSDMFGPVDPKLTLLIDILTNTWM